MAFQNERRTRAFGVQCPMGHGVLYDLSGRLWCPNNDHGGNGRFFAEGETQMAFAGTGPAPKPEVRVRKVRSDAGKPRGSRPVQPVAVEAAPVAPKPVAPAKSPSRGEPKPCTCGCGGFTKGGRFLPGHDARYHAAQKRAAASK